MKLKCDRNFPCSNCRKRGCGDICPDGTLKGEGRSSRMQAEMSQLIARCQELTTIVRDLGGADLLPPPLTLEFVNTKLTPKDSDSAGRKVALKDSKGDDGEELGIEETQSPQRSRARSLIKDDIAMDEEEQDQAQGDEEEVLEGVGSLSIRDSDGRSRYLGVSAGSALYSKVRPPLGVLSNRRLRLQIANPDSDSCRLAATDALPRPLMSRKTTTRPALMKILASRHHK